MGAFTSAAWRRVQLDSEVFAEICCLEDVNCLPLCRLLGLSQPAIMLYDVHHLCQVRWHQSFWEGVQVTLAFVASHACLQLPSLAMCQVITQQPSYVLLAQWWIGMLIYCPQIAPPLSGICWAGALLSRIKTHLHCLHVPRCVQCCSSIQAASPSLQHHDDRGAYCHMLRGVILILGKWAASCPPTWHVGHTGWPDTVKP